MRDWLARRVGIDSTDAVSAIDFGWGASWAQQHTFWVMLLCAAAASIAAAYYLFFQPAFRTSLCVVGIVMRAVGLIALVLVFAQPVLQVTLVEQLRPLMLLVFDGSDSMNLPSSGAAGGGDSQTRIQQVQQTLVARQKTLDTLTNQYRLLAYLSSDAGELLPLQLNDDKDSQGTTIDAKFLASQLRADAEVSALGTSLEQIRRRHSGRHLDRLVLVGDFAVNSGKPVLTEAGRLTAEIDTVGVGARQIADASVSLQADLVIKKDEQRTVKVEIHQTGLSGTGGQLQLVARHLGGGTGFTVADTSTATPVGPVQMIEFDQPRMTLEIPYRPTEAGHVRLEARLETFGEESLMENNVAARDVTVRDESIKLLFIEHEPTYEWRFVKEVFHRDRLVGREGFRTYLHSADFSVRRNNRMFLGALEQPRAEFFANDVIFISDVSAELLSTRYQDQLVEYVRDFGGGLVVIAGPRFSAKTLSETSLADMLPVVLGGGEGVRLEPFQLQLSPAAADEDFMQLADRDEENLAAWENLNPLLWYQPVVRLHPQGIALANHPSDHCIDGATPQPLIAVRRFGKGEVVYFGFNEMWRLRRLHGNTYYRRFWGQLMYRLGLSHALGSQKRFKVTIDRDSYQVGNQLNIRVEAYDENFKPLETEKLTSRLLSSGDDESQATEIPLTATETGTEFVASAPLFVEGMHRLLVDDPVKQESVEVVFNVEPVSIERRSAVRNVALQNELAAQSGGRALELNELSELTGIEAPLPIEETTMRYIPLWNTWLTVILVIGLFLLEWTVRKFADLS